MDFIGILLVKSVTVIVNYLPKGIGTTGLHNVAYIIVIIVIKVLHCSIKRIAIFYYHSFITYRLKVTDNTSANAIAAKHKIVCFSVLLSRLLR